MKRVAILQSNYIPWKGYFDLINMVDEFIIYDEMQYTKNDWRNRNKIKTPDGTKWLTIPVRQKCLNQKINETEITDSDWSRKHYATLKQFYKAAPYFKTYIPFLEELYLTPQSNYLSEVNVKFIKAINNLLGINTAITDSKEYGLIEGKTERLVDLVQKAGGTEYISGPAARLYVDEDLFEKANIRLTWMDYTEYPIYEQFYPPFEHGVTVLDLLLLTGPEATCYMKSFKA